MKKVYICSPYKAKNGAELDRNIEYAQELTRQAIEAGLAPITPHLYMTQCLNEDKPEERAKGMAAGLELLRACEFILVGVRYGISEGMSKEIETAERLHLDVVNADKLRYYIKTGGGRLRKAAAITAQYKKNDFNGCRFCKGLWLSCCPAARR